MKMLVIAILFIALTIIVYFVMNTLYMKVRSPFLIPILTSTIVLISILLVFQVPYETYMIGGKWIDALLGPAIVSLAIPLYKQRALIKQYALSIFIGVGVGVIFGMASGVVFMQLAKFSHELVVTMLPKSITTPIAMQISGELQGYPSLTTAFVIIAGIVGAVSASYLYKFLGITTAVGKGIGYGVASHAIGTSKALEVSDEEGAVSSVAMTLSAIIGSIVGPLYAFLFLT